MKTILENIGKLLTVVLFTVFGLGNAKAQTHNKAAANCVFHAEFVKDKTKKVSAVDGYCKICGNKKEEEHKKKLAAEKAALEQKNKQSTEKQKQEYAKALAEQKRKAEIEKQKVKDNEAVLVAPKVNNSPKAKTELDSDDKHILDINKDYDVKATYSKRVFKIYYSYDYQQTELRKIDDGLKINTKSFIRAKSLNPPMVHFVGRLLNNGFFICAYGEDVGEFYRILQAPSHKYKIVYDLISLKGNAKFNDENIFLMKLIDNDKIILMGKYDENGDKKYFKYDYVNEKYESLSLAEAEKYK